ncbi:ATP-binding protein [Thiovibrio sp. JS02]
MHSGNTNELVMAISRKIFLSLSRKFPGLPAILILPFLLPAAAIADPPRERPLVPAEIDPAPSGLDSDGPLPHPAGPRKIRVGLYENKPKIFSDENGRASGIFVGILDAIAQEEHWEVTYVPCKWHECLADLEKGRLDLIPDVAFSQERDLRFDFHQEAVLDSWSQVYATGQKPVERWADLNGRRVALLKDSIQRAALGQMMNGLGYDIAMVETDSYEKAFALAADGAVDAVVANHFFGHCYYQEYGLKMTAIVFNPASLYFATDQDANPDLLAAIDRGLRAMKSEAGSVYYRELARWLERPPRPVVPRYLLWLIGGTTGLLALASGAIFLLRRQVKSRTRHLLRANETLRESEEKFRSLFQNHPVVKLIIDPENGRIVEANRAAVDFYGWPAEQLRRLRLQDLDPPAAGQVEAEMAKARTGQRFHFEFRHRLADGSLRDVEVLAGRIEIRGKMLLHTIIRDITDHRKLEEQYRQAQKMEAVGRLAGGVAHDYNNILSVIIGYAELALEKTGPADPLRADLQEIHTAAIRSRDITRQLLAFARKETIAPVLLDLNAAVAGLLNILRRLIGEDIDLDWRPGPGLWPVLLDPSQLDQILANLCVNARDAIADVGRITIETGTVTFDASYCADHAGFVPGDFVLLAVSDNGCGMDRGTLDKIFEPFFTTKCAKNGTGLGLATVYGIVKQNNGFINVYSEPGQGTTFRIYLPGQTGEMSREPLLAVETCQAGNGETLLVVEDDIAILGLVEKMLTKLNYRVLPAGTPSEALLSAEAHGSEISLLLTDVVLPEMNGRELAEKLKSLCPGVKCLFMSGYTANVIVHRGVLDKGIHFIQKPFSGKDLADKIRAVLAESADPIREKEGDPEGAD